MIGHAINATDRDEAAAQAAYASAMLNILADYSEERVHLGDTQRALLNIVDDLQDEQTQVRYSQKAALNILEDFAAEKIELGSTQRAVVNILEDFATERDALAATQQALINILDDAAAEKILLAATQNALTNILEDAVAEKAVLEVTQRAFLNILEDFDSERNERKQAEETVRDLNNTLEAKVAERTTALTAANQELEEFSYETSHVLRAPLRAMDGFSRILIDDYADKLGSEGKRLLNVVQSNARQMGELIEGILGFLRLGRDELVRRPINMTNSVRSALAELEPKTRGRQLRIKVGPLPNAFGDAAMIQRVWSNLLDNAVKFTAPKAAGRIEVGATVGDGETVYYVRDNGAGYDMQYADKLFGVFRRVHGSEFDGNGMGLATVKRIVTRHGGRVWAEGKVGAGATFYFALPSEETKHAGSQ